MMEHHVSLWRFALKKMIKNAAVKKLIKSARKLTLIFKIWRLRINEQSRATTLNLTMLELFVARTLKTRPCTCR